MSRRTTLRILCIPGREEAIEQAFGRIEWPDGALLEGFEWNRERWGGRFRLQAAALRRILESRDPPAPQVVVARSFGAWLLVHALTGLGRPPTTAVLIAPVLGFGASSRLGFVAPGAFGFWSRVEDPATPPPSTHLTIALARDDAQSPIELAERLARVWRVRVVAFDSGGHALGKTSGCREISDLIRDTIRAHAGRFSR